MAAVVVIAAVVASVTPLIVDEARTAHYVVSPPVVEVFSDTASQIACLQGEVRSEVSGGATVYLAIDAADPPLLPLVVTGRAVPVETPAAASSVLSLRVVRGGCEGLSLVVSPGGYR